MAGTGRLFSRKSPSPDLQPLVWDAGDPWKLWLDVRQDDRDQWKITGSLRRGEERMELTEPAVLVEGGFLVARGTVARLDDGGAFPWITRLLTLKQIPFPDRERDNVMSKLLDLNIVPPLDLDEKLKFEERRMQPKLGLRVTQHREGWGEDYFQALLLLDYGRGWTEAGSAGRGLWLPEERVYMVRDTESEDAAREKLRELGLRPTGEPATAWRMGVKAMPKVARELIHAGWHVEAEGKAFRRPGTTKVDVRSGIDWFELHGEVDYDGQIATLPQLLAAVRRGDTMVRLGDGTYGLLPEEWLGRFAPLGGSGLERRGPPALQAQSGGIAGRAAGCPTRSARRRVVRACARTHADLQRREVGCRSPRASSVNCAIISAKAWAGWSFCVSSASAAVWRTIWVSGKRPRYSPFSKRGAPRVSALRWSWRRNR